MSHKLLLALSLGAAFAFLAAARSWECPTPQDVSGPGVLRETPAQIQRTANLLASGDAGNRVPEIVADLRKRHPGVRNAALVNYLVTAYCPVVTRLSGLSDAEKRSRVDRFATQAIHVVNRE